MKKRLHKSKKEKQKEADKKEFRELRSIMSKIKNKTATDAEKKKYPKLRETVTGKVKPGSKAAKRRKSFCARMKGMPGPMKDSKGRPTRKAMSLRRWRCG